MFRCISGKAVPGCVTGPRINFGLLGAIIIIRAAQQPINYFTQTANHTIGLLCWFIQAVIAESRHLLH